jgi:hypothetical protein
MTDQIIDGLMGTGGNTAGFFPETNERLLEQGVIGVYRGARIITLKNYLDDTDTPFFPANELWVIGRDASKFRPIRQQIAGCVCALGPDREVGDDSPHRACIRIFQPGRGSRRRGAAASCSRRRFCVCGNPGIAAGTSPARLPDALVADPIPGG